MKIFRGLPPGPWRGGEDGEKRLRERREEDWEGLEKKGRKGARGVNVGGIGPPNICDRLTPLAEMFKQ